MAAERRSLPIGKLNLNNTIPTTPSDIPPISALFLIRFDLKAGYTISWKKALPNIELEGVVEYKSLPSGLHTVKEDLIYFVHGNYAGISAFVSAPASEAQRNAVMIAVGVLVPLDFGRLGRSWKHAPQLQDIAQQLARDGKDLSPLENYWTSNRPSPENELTSTPAKSQRRRSGHGRNRSASDGTMLFSADSLLPQHHPALRLSQLLKTFGPLIFPIYRAALLRKRILISCHAPVQEICDFVYNVSVLSNLPLAVADLTIPSAPPQRLRPLFTIGVHDIPLLEEDHRASKIASPQADLTNDTSEPLGQGWVACTTDDILGQKNTLYDVLITMPTTNPSWPTIQTSSKTAMKATQRDLRRYRALNWSLSRSTPSPSSADARPGLGRRQSTNNFLTTNEASLSIQDTDPIVEPLSWSALAYSGFMWWASAGTPEISINDEFSSDAALLDDLVSQPHSPETAPSDMASSTSSEVTLETSIIAYFHRLTTTIFETISEIIEDSMESDDGESINQADEVSRVSTNTADAAHGAPIYITTDDMMRMGLDDWSSEDYKFVIEMCRVYFGKSAVIEGRNLDVCGVRIC